MGSDPKTFQLWPEQQKLLLNQCRTVYFLEYYIQFFDPTGGIRAGRGEVPQREELCGLWHLAPEARPQLLLAGLGQLLITGMQWCDFVVLAVTV